MYDMVKWIVGSIVRGELQDHEPSWGLVVDDVRDERHGEHVIQQPVNRAGGPWLVRSPASCCVSGWGSQVVMASTVERPRYAS